MSLVGPRPMPPYEASLKGEEGESRRTEVRPGLTGPEQINYFLHGPHSLREGAGWMRITCASAHSLRI